MTRTDVDTDVPADAEAHVCSYCGRPFAREKYLVLHRGLAHPDDVSDGERDAYERAYAEEQADIDRFRIVALGVLVVIYFGFLFAYAVFAA
ncbi:C2H2-type zinc finger protein [Haloplanus sp. GCM10025708]|uniref:DUF7410 domain-containing protein n=1 Tax=Haloferacaceae TaxID=1644056 RepID=UPI003612A3F7